MQDIEQTITSLDKLSYFYIKKKFSATRCHQKDLPISLYACSSSDDRVLTNIGFRDNIDSMLNSFVTKAISHREFKERFQECSLGAYVSLCR